MSKISAETAREVADLVKPFNLFKQIEEKAIQGEYSITVTFLSKLAFELLIDEGYDIYAANGEVKLTRYNEDSFKIYHEFEISWEG